MNNSNNDNDAGVVFRLFPSGMTPDEATSANDKLWAEHDAEAKRRNAEFYNYGWVQGDHDACSKTSRGNLSSVIDPGTMAVTHHWSDW